MTSAWGAMRIGISGNLSDMWSLNPSPTAQTAIRPNKGQPSLGNLPRFGEMSLSDSLPNNLYNWKALQGGREG